jgi:hypothetical protein
MPLLTELSQGGQSVASSGVWIIRVRERVGVTEERA